MKNKIKIGTVLLLRTRRFVRSSVVPTVFLLAVPFLTSCGGGRSTAVNPPPPPATVAVTISPFMPTGSMGSARGGHTATLLLNGQVLVAGGASSPFDLPLSAELYVPVSGALTVTGNIAEK